MGVILEFIEQRKVLVAAVGGTLAGVVLGLALGWGVWPVEWTNATPAHLRSDFQQAYVLFVAEDYARTGDLERARDRLGVQYWEEDELATVLTEVEQAQDGQQALAVRRLSMDLVTAPAAPVAPGETMAARLQPVAMVCGVGLLVVALVGGGLYLYTSLSEGREVVRQPEASPRPVAAREAAPAGEVAWEGQPPNAQFVTTYTLGDDRYDPSFSIELETGEFMGECGVGISETIGTDSPEKVTALEVWLFDKNDIRTVTKVLMSKYAFNDEALRTKLAPKGEPVLSEEGKDLVLETKMLHLRAHVVEVEYAQDDLPRDSFFERFTVELAAWVKSEADEPESGIPFGPPGAS